MDTALIEEIINVLVQAVQYGIKYGPDVIADIKLAYQLASSGTTLTDDQIASARKAVADAHAALQTQIAADEQADAAASLNNGA